MTGEEQSEGMGLQAGRSEAEELLDERQGGDEMVKEGNGFKRFQKHFLVGRGKIISRYLLVCRTR